MALSGWSTSGPKCLRLGKALATAPPLSFAGWFKSTSTSTTQSIVQIENSANASDHFILRTDPTGNLRAVAGRTTDASAQSTTTFLANVWNHGVATFTSSTSRAVYLNGGGKGTNTTSKVPASLNRTSIGLDDAALAGSPFLGALAKIGVWDAVLTDFEAFMLGQGADPRTIRPDSLLAYIGCNGNGDEEPDLSGSANAFAAIGALTPADEGFLTDIPFDREWFDRAIDVPAVGPQPDMYGSPIFRLQYPGWR